MESNFFNMLDEIKTIHEKPKVLDCCVFCEEKNIYNKKRKLCHKCYSWGHRNGLIEYPTDKWIEIYKENKQEKNHNKKLDSRVLRLRNIKNKYGPEFFKDIKKTNTHYAWTLTAVAKKYNLSRERVRQFYNLIYESGFRPKQLEKKLANNDYITCSNDFRRKKADYKNGSIIHECAIVKNLFADKLSLYGINYEIPCEKGADFIISGNYVVVRRCARPLQTGKNSYIHTTLTENQRNLCHFIVIFYTPKKDFYIIPNNDQGENLEGKKNIFIPTETYNGPQAQNNYLREYKNAFYILRRGR